MQISRKITAIFLLTILLACLMATAQGQDDKKPQTKKEAAGPVRREIRIQKRYLHLPVKNKAPKRRVRFDMGGETVREFTIELADGDPDFWYFCDVSAFQGETVQIEVDKLPAESKGLETIRQADAIPDAENVYKEKHRQQFHFSSRRGWNNDPNGLVYYKGEYHLYYQHNPYGWAWGNMHWAHAVSADLVHWKELPIAIYPYKFGDWVFSGGAMVDWKNTAGFKTGDEDVIIATYTSTGRGEAIAYSNDRGRTFTDYEGNPVVEHKGRDPKVFWYEPGGHWVMAVYDQVEKKHYIAFYTSKDLKEWEFQSRIEGYYECPEIFELPVDGDPDNKKWVLYAADGKYAVGQFDGKVFTAESEKLPGNYGNCFYASQTYSDIPAEDGRRIQIGWGRIATPGMPFNQCMLFPCELTLRATNQGTLMFTNPVKEIENIHEKKHAFRNLDLKAGDDPLYAVRGDLFHIRAEFENRSAKEYGFRIRGVEVAYDPNAWELRCGNRKAYLKPQNERVRLEILVDRTSIEIYANDGLVYMPIKAVPEDGADPVPQPYVKGGSARLTRLDVYELRSIWN